MLLFNPEEIKKAIHENQAKPKKRKEKPFLQEVIKMVKNGRFDEARLRELGFKIGFDSTTKETTDFASKGRFEIVQIYREGDRVDFVAPQTYYQLWADGVLILERIERFEDAGTEVHVFSNM